MKRLFCLLLMLVLVGCGGQTSASSSTAPATSAAASPIASASPAPSSSAAASSATPSAAAASAAAAPAAVTPGPGEFANPVIDRDFPDPDVLKVGDTYYAYATNGGGTNVQTATSTDLVSWSSLADALPSLPTWARSGLTWAPDVSQSADGKTFILYFTARDNASDKQCIGAATADAPQGPFRSAADTAFICQADIGGSIDPGSFVDEDGTRYVLWKNDGNCCGFATWLYIQRTSADGLTLEGEPTKLITNDQPWEGRLIEAPTLWKQGSKYYLLYSANDYAGIQYAVGYAVADSPTGPFTKPVRKPLLKTDFGTGGALGPGGQDIVLDKDGDTWLVYHSWNATNTYRRMQLDELVWEGETPVVLGPDKLPQPVP